MFTIKHIIEFNCAYFVGNTEYKEGITLAVKNLFYLFNIITKM